MPIVPDRDRFFLGQLNASTPKHIIGEGELVRLINGRFIKGAVTNAISFEEIPLEYIDGADAFASQANTTYQKLLTHGDVQLVAPLANVAGEFLVYVISGRLFQHDLQTGLIVDITPQNTFLPESSAAAQLSYLDNDGGVYGLGGYLVIFNGYNRPIFVGPDEVRLSNRNDFEVPPARLGATAGNRMFVIVGDNILYASDPLGGATSPLVFQETLDIAGTYYQQVFRIGFPLQAERVTAIARLPTYLAPTPEFLARNLLVSTERHKFVVAAGAPRNTWDQIEFISYAGSLDGIAGPHASTNVGDTIMYVSSTGRIKTLSQDQQRETGLAETFIDDSLGQFLTLGETQYHFRDWYRELDHSRSVIKFNRDRVYTTVYPVGSPGLDFFGRPNTSPSHRALAVGSIDPLTRLGPTATISWEGFYDFLNPIGIVVLENHLYVLSKDEYGTNRLYRENFGVPDDHTTSIFTRGYFSTVDAEGRILIEGRLFFRVLEGPLDVQISYLVNDKWVKGDRVRVTKQFYNFNFKSNRAVSTSASIPLRIDIHHGGSRFELESIYVYGELHKEVR